MASAKKVTKKADALLCVAAQISFTLAHSAYCTNIVAAEEGSFARSYPLTRQRGDGIGERAKLPLWRRFGPYLAKR